MAPQSTEEMIDSLTFKETTAAELRGENGSASFRRSTAITKDEPGSQHKHIKLKKGNFFFWFLELSSNN